MLLAHTSDTMTKNHGPAAEIVYRLLTTPMDYTTFASTNPTSKDQKVNEDLNIEYVRATHYLFIQNAVAFPALLTAILDPQQYPRMDWSRGPYGKRACGCFRSPFLLASLESMRASNHVTYRVTDSFLDEAILIAFLHFGRL